MADNRDMMVAPMLLGYALGAIGVYALLYRFAPVKADESKTHAPKTQVYTIFEDDATLGRAA